MKRKVNPIPKGYHTITPYLLVEDAGKLIDFLKRAFGAKVVDRMAAPDGRVAHASVKVGNSMLMLGAAHGKWKPTPAMVYLYVDKVDAQYRRALKAGATTIMEPADQFWGDRHGGVQDAFGNQWWISTRIENVSPAELKKRAQAYFKQQSC